MEKRTSPSTPAQPRFGEPRMVHAPHRAEGIGNALRSAFDPGHYGLPDDMAQLLKRMDG